MADIAGRVKGIAKVLQDGGDTLDRRFPFQARQKDGLSRGSWFWIAGLMVGSSKLSLKAREKTQRS